MAPLLTVSGFGAALLSVVAAVPSISIELIVMPAALSSVVSTGTSVLSGSAAVV